MATKSKSLTQKAIKQLLNDKLAIISFIIIIVYILIALLIQINILKLPISETVGASYEKPSWSHILGTDIFGRDVFIRVLYGIKISISIGLITIAIAVPIGIILGSLAGYFGGRVDDFIVWLYSTFSSIPYLLFLLSLALVLGKGIFSVYIALGVTSWVGICRVVRGEFIKYRERDFVSAANALGAQNSRIIFKHILPNVMPLIFINASLLFVYAIKAEVILSYIGVGVQGKPSWGNMISDAKLELVGRGVYWQFLGATLAMFIIVLAFNIFSDALRDCFDPRISAKKK